MTGVTACNSFLAAGGVSCVCPSYGHFQQRRREQLPPPCRDGYLRTAEKSIHGFYLPLYGSGFSVAHTHGTASVRPKHERCEAILATLEECASTGRLTPGTAKEIFGKLSFCLQSLFGRVGRASALPLVQRCNDGRDTSFNNALREMLRFFKIILHPQNLPSRTFRLGQPARPPVLVYSDASESPDYRGLGVVVHDEEDPRTLLRGRRLPALARGKKFTARRQLHLLTRASSRAVRAAHFQ